MGAGPAAGGGAGGLGGQRQLPAGSFRAGPQQDSAGRSVQLAAAARAGGASEAQPLSMVPHPRAGLDSRQPYLYR